MPLVSATTSWKSTPFQTKTPVIGRRHLGVHPVDDRLRIRRAVNRRTAVCDRSLSAPDARSPSLFSTAPGGTEINRREPPLPGSDCSVSARTASARARSRVDERRLARHGNRFARLPTCSSTSTVAVNSARSSMPGALDGGEAGSVKVTV
jgi:hypothetical protein